MEKIITKENKFKELVHIIRGQQVMLDSDLAKLYGTEVKKLIQQVKRNNDKFPNDFMFQLAIEEAIDISRSQIVTLNKRGKILNTHLMLLQNREYIWSLLFLRMI